MRFLILITTSCFALAACNSGKHPTQILLSNQGKKNSKTADQMGKPGKDSDGNPVSGCLNLLNVVSTLTAASEDTYSVYTSDMDLGNFSITPGAGSCITFVPTAETKPKAALFLQMKSDPGPHYFMQTPGDILNSPDLGELLLIGGQKQCDNVSVNKTIRDVVCKDAKSITIKGSAQDSYIQYALTDTSALTVTYYQPENELPTNCGQFPPIKVYSKVVREISTKPGRSTIDTEFAQLLAESVAVVPAELTKALEASKPKTLSKPDLGNGSIAPIVAPQVQAQAKVITVSDSTLNYVYQQFNQGRNKLSCSPEP